MNIDSISIYYARWVIPIVSEPIHGGWVRMRGEEVVEVGRGKPPSFAIDLGDVALLPGLVNAHTHLEFSDCRQPIGQPGIQLSDWITEVIRTRGATTLETQRQAIIDGLQESRDAGVRLLGEITTPPCEYPTQQYDSELVTFAEVLGLSEDRAAERLSAAIEHNALTLSGGWSPHAPYSTPLDLIDRCADLALDSGRPLAMHVAESPAERELIAKGTGPFADALKRMGVWREGVFPWKNRGFTDLIEMLAKAPFGLLIHGNDLSDDEIRCLATHKNLSVVYCPRTHAFFRYADHPVEVMIRQGVRVALGTDSRASNPDLNIWKEVQFLLKHRRDLMLHDVLSMATIHGADAFGRHDVGRIAVGCRPSLGIVSTSATNEQELASHLAENDYRPLNGESKIRR